LIERDFLNQRQIVLEMTFISCSGDQKIASILLNEKMSEQILQCFSETVNLAKNDL
jgi:hypothetical protein